MEVVPLDSVDREVMSFISLHILASVCLRAQMDLAFFGTDKEKMVLELIEIETHSSG